ncbi:MAG: hypothetical protein KC646_13120 [Candidatus Cloacimonetes bacterium]|nr:hypothetical protein [Candidatus Cloacimonadota bacterium]
MKNKISYIHKQTTPSSKKINQELAEVLGEAFVMSLLEDFEEYAIEIDNTPLTGTFS